MKKIGYKLFWTGIVLSLVSVIIEIYGLAVVAIGYGYGLALASLPSGAMYVLPDTTTYPHILRMLGLLGILVGVAATAIGRGRFSKKRNKQPNNPIPYCGDVPVTTVTDDWRWEGYFNSPHPLS